MMPAGFSEFEVKRTRRAKIGGVIEKYIDVRFMGVGLSNGAMEQLRVELHSSANLSR